MVIYRAIVNDHTCLGLGMGRDEITLETDGHFKTRKSAIKWVKKYIEVNYPAYFNDHPKDLEKHWADLGAIGVSIENIKVQN